MCVCTDKKNALDVWLTSFQDLSFAHCFQWIDVINLLLWIYGLVSWAYRFDKMYREFKMTQERKIKARIQMSSIHERQPRSTHFRSIYATVLSAQNESFNRLYSLLYPLTISHENSIRMWYFEFNSILVTQYRMESFFFLL